MLRYPPFFVLGAQTSQQTHSGTLVLQSRAKFRESAATDLPAVGKYEPT